MHNSKIETIFNTKKISGNFCEFVPVSISDAEFIFNLRTKRKDSFLKPTQGTALDQTRYLEKYLEELPKKEQIYYKIIDTKTKKGSGVLRITELEKKEIFNWQSFVVKEDASPNVALDAMLMVYRIGFEYLERNKCGPWEVDKNFEKMIKIHNFLKMAKIIGEDDKYFLFAVTKEDYKNNIGRFLKMGYGKLEGLNG